MQANVQPAGQQNRSRNWTFHNTGPGFQRFLATTGNYCSQFSRKTLRTPTDQTGTSNPQSTNKLQPMQENHKLVLPAGQQNLRHSQWNHPVSGCQMFLPESCMNALDAASSNNRNTYSNSVCVQPQTTSTPNSSQQFTAKTVITTKSLNNTGRDLNSCLLSQKQLHTNATNNNNLSSFGRHIYQRLNTKNSASHANMQTAPAHKPNLSHVSAAQKAVAIVTPLTPVQTAAVTVARQDDGSVSAESREDDDETSAAANKKTDAEDTNTSSTLPVTEWSLNKLRALISFIQKLEKSRQKNVSKTDAGEQILKLYWNGDFNNLNDALQSGIYHRVMSDISSHCLSDDDVILRQIKKGFSKQLAEDFHVLKHDEAPPQTLYKSCWMNLNEALDDIDRECGYSWCFKSLYSNYSNQDGVQHKNPAQKLQTRRLDASDVTSLTKTVNDMPEQQQTLSKLNNKNTNAESRDERFVPVTSDDNSVKLTGVIEEQTKCPVIAETCEFVTESSCQQNTVNPLKAITDLVKTLERTFSRRKQQRSKAATSRTHKKAKQDERLHRTFESRVITTEPAAQTSDQSEVNNSAHTTQNTSLGSPCESSQTGHQSPAEEQTSSDLKERNSENESHTFLGLTQTGDNSSPMPSSAVTEQTNCQPNTVNALKGLTDLLTTMNKCDVSLRIYEHQVGQKEILKRMQNCSFKTSVEQQTPCQSNGPENLSMNENSPIIIDDEPPAASDHNISLEHKRSLPEPNNGSDPHTDPLGAMAGLVWKLDKQKVSLRKRQHQIGREISKRKRQPSAEASGDGGFSDEPFEIQILPSEVANRCFEGEKIEVCLKDQRLQVTVPLPETKRESSSCLSCSEKCDKGVKQRDSVFRLSHHAPKLLQEENVWGSFEEEEIQKISTEASGHPEKSRHQTDLTNPAKLKPVDEEQLEFLQSKYNEKMPKGVPENNSSAADALQVHAEENLLSHQAAARWFCAEKTEDLKPKERKNPAVVDVKLKSYCCFSKWLQTLKFADISSCICQVKAELNKQDLKTHGVFSDHRYRELKMSSLEKVGEDVSEGTERTAAEDKSEFVKLRSVSKEVLKQEGATSEKISDESTTTHSQNVKKRTQSSDVMSTKAMCLSPFASSSNSQDAEKQKRSENICEEPCEKTTSSYQNSSKKQRRDFSVKHNDLDMRKKLRASLQFQDVALKNVSEVTKENVLSSTLSKHLFNPKHCVKRDENKQKNTNLAQMSKNKCVIRRKTVTSRFLQSPSVMKSKYELGNPALMPLRDAVGLEFKVLPSSFIFSGADVHLPPADTASAQPAEDKTAKQMKTSHSSIQGKWCFSPLKIKIIQSSEVSGSSSVFQQFQSKYQERKKKMDSEQNLKSS